ncbi:uncharacterized protein LOC111326027 [Stylophora pistillata]|uniref:uncharacterized protein LOC111326027 n=1 Tax=Stylophora pistillata TaxID=50429 RepID=UPI000C0563FA|nr:uncharacterized protein LOC111326027 [Stylophora pistillata]
MDVSGNGKRWLVTLVTSNKVVAPVLQDIVKQGMDKLYVTLDNYLRGLVPLCSLQTLTYADVCRLAATPNLASSLKDLNFGNINNNFVDHGKTKGVYNYNVSSPVDLAKLYLPHYLVAFSAFDKSMDLSVALRLLGCRKYPIQVFVSTDRLHNIQSLADDVRENVRNRGGHFKESDWTQIMFDQCFDKLKALLQYLPLLPDKKKEVLNELSAWKTEGFKRIVDNDVKDLMEKFQDVKLASINEKLDDIPTKEENERAMKKLFSFHTSMMDRFDRMESRMESLIRQVNRKLEGISKQMYFADEEPTGGNAE